MKERIAERIEGLIVGRHRDGRAVYSSAGKRALIHACLQPGISVAGSALANGINANLLRKWIRQHQNRQRTGSSKAMAPKVNGRVPELLPVQLSEPIATPNAQPPTLVTAITTKPHPHALIEIEYAGARLILRGRVNAEQLRTVLTCLARA